MNTSKNQRGDTIVEVLIGAAILSLALMTSYALSSISLHNGIAANQRQEALALAQSQVDLLAYQKNNDTSFASDYQKNGSHFCINQDTTRSPATGSLTTTDLLCDGYNGTVYNIGVSYASSNQTFTITATWNDSRGPNGLDKLTLYYKLAGNY